MIKLQVIDNNNWQYNLIDENGRKYNICLNFCDIESQPESGDIIYISEKLLNAKYEGYSTSYTFGDLESIYGKEKIQIDDIDIVKLVIGKREIYLKRLYG